MDDKLAKDTACLLCKSELYLHKVWEQLEAIEEEKQQKQEQEEQE